MTTVIVPVNAYAASLSIPADGEGVSAASVALYVQEIANRLEFIRQRHPGANPVANLLKVIKSAGEAVLFPGSTNYQIGLSTISPGVVNNLAVSVTEVFLVQFEQLVPGTVIRNFTAIHRAAGAHAALPAVMPKIELCKLDLTGYIGAGVAPVVTVVDTQSDVSGTTAAFQLAHTITKAIGAPPTVGANEMWFLRATGESGANALLGAQWTSFSLDVSA